MTSWERGTPAGDAAYRRRWENEHRALMSDLEHIQGRIEMLGTEGERLHPRAQGRCGLLAGAAVGTVEGAISLLRELSFLLGDELNEEPTEPGRVMTPAAGGAIPNRREPR